MNMFYKNYKERFLKNSCDQLLLDKKIQKSKSSCGNHIFLACQPKSGSTFLGNAIAELTGYRWSQFRQAPIDNVNEQDIYFPSVLDNYEINSITQQHTRASNANIELLKFADAKIIVLTRNIFDVVISSLDHSEKQKIVGSPMTYANDEYYKLTDEQKINMTIDLAVPWHIHFYVSWYDAMVNKNVKLLWITYEEMITDQVGTIERMLKF